MSNIHVNTKILEAIRAIDEGEVDPIVDINNEFIYWLETFNKELGNLVYTEFNKLTGVGLRSYTVRYGTYHTVYQVMFGGGMIRHPHPLIYEMFPNYDPAPIPDSYIIPSCY